MIRHIATICVGLVLATSPVYAQDTFTVTTASADVHNSPSTGGVVIGHAPRGGSYEVTRDLGSWVRIAWPGTPDRVGFVHVSRGTRTRRQDVAPTAFDVHAAVRSVAEASSRQPAAVVAQSPSTLQMAPAAVPLPSHRIGLGARMGSEAFGFAATGRVWAKKAVGVQLEAGRSTYSSVLAGDRIAARTTYVAPSVIYSPRDMLASAVWLRPYVGTGVNFTRSHRDLTLDGSDVTENGLGYHGFGGAELTWANLPQFAVSADLRRQWTPDPLNGLRDGRFGFSLSGHWYVR